MSELKKENTEVKNDVLKFEKRNKLHMYLLKHAVKTPLLKDWYGWNFTHSVRENCYTIK